MISKSIQSADLANILSSAPQTASSRGTEGSDGPSFPISLSAHMTDIPGKGTGKPSPAPGNKLPEHALQIESQDPAMDAAMPGVDLPNASENPDIIDVQFLATTLGLSGQPVEYIPRQQLRAHEMPTGGESMPTPVQPSVQLNDQPLQAVAHLPGQVYQAPALTTTGQVQLAIRAMGQPETVEIPLVAADYLQKNPVTDTGQVQVRTAVNRFPAVETGRVSPHQEPIPNIMREAVQLAVASQAGNGELQQSLQGHRGSQPGHDVTAALTRTETNPLAFLQTLSESSPLTLPSARVQVPVGKQGWGDAVGQQVTWFVSQNVSAANLRLNPQHLGPVEMQISMEGDKASISFLSQHTVVREALESSLPRLREMLAESGLDLVNVNISQQGASDKNARNWTELQQGLDFSHLGSGSNEMEAGENIQQPPATMVGLIDDYA